jgi:chemotaxis protein methyltransferase CheR
MLPSMQSRPPSVQTPGGIALANAQQLLREKDLLLEEMEHRFANSLQIISSILLIKARTVQSDETRLQLLDAHQRVLSVAAVQKHLHLSGPNESIEIAHYLTKLCESLAQSMIRDRPGNLAYGPSR